MMATEGRVIVTGMGKSGHIAGKDRSHIGEHWHTRFFCSPWGSLPRRYGDDHPQRLCPGAV